MMSDILVFLLLALNFQGSDTAMALVTNTSLNENHFLQCDDPIVLTCSIPTYSNTMTWQVNSVITAQCAFGSCTTNLPPPTNHVYAFDQINKKFTITINNTLLADNGTNFVCGDGITSTSLTTIVKVTPDNDEVVVTSMENSTNVNIVVTTGCSDTEDVTITWYYTKDASSSSPSPYTDEHAVTVPLPDTACETGNCGLNGFVKKQSTLNIKKSTSGDLYYFKILIKHPSTSGYFVTTNKSYFIKVPPSNSYIVWKVLCGIAVALKIVCIILTIVLIIIGPQGEIVIWGLSKCDIADIVLDCVVLLYSLIVGAIGVSKNDECRNSADSKACLGLCGTSIALTGVNLIVLVWLIFKRQGWCGKHLTCLNTVLPVCKDTEARGPPDGKSDNPAAKEKHREVKLLTHKEQLQQHHKETVVNKGKPSGEKHEELSKGQPRPLPVPTGNNRPMPEIPSDRHKRGLSANFNDDHDKPLDDNIVHTLPVVKKPKTALDPMNAEDQSKNSDDQPKKKKKKKKDRDTSRSEEMEDGY